MAPSPVPGDPAAGWRFHVLIPSLNISALPESKRTCTPSWLRRSPAAAKSFDGTSRMPPAEFHLRPRRSSAILRLAPPRRFQVLSESEVTGASGCPTPSPYSTRTTGERSGTCQARATKVPTSAPPIPRSAVGFRTSPRIPLRREACQGRCPPRSRQPQMARQTSPWWRQFETGATDPAPLNLPADRRPSECSVARFRSPC